MLNFTPELAAALRGGPWHFVVTGANGWLGRATLTMLHAALGDRFAARVTALGSRASTLALDGFEVAVSPLLDWQPAMNTATAEGAAPLLVFHYAFLTKDRVAGLAPQEFELRNVAIREALLAWFKTGRIAGAVVPSSGAVYDYLRADPSRDPAATLYGRLKFEDEEAFAAACTAHGASLILPRVFNLAGPCINKFDAYALASFIVQVLQGGALEVRARKPVLRSYYYVGDLLQLCTALLLRQSAPAVLRFDTASDEVVEMGALAQQVVSVLDAPAAMQRAPLDPEQKEDRYVGERASIARLERELKLQPKTLQQQIAATAEDIRRVLRGATE